MAVHNCMILSVKLAAPAACCLLLLLASYISPGAAHAYVKIPRSRGTFLATTSEYGPDGADYQWSAYNGRANVCGDGGQAEKASFNMRMASQATYAPGSIATFTVKMRVVHWGRVEFRICRYTGAEASGLTRGCVNSRVLIPAPTSDPRYIGNFWYLGSSGVGDYTMQYRIPSDLSCDGVTSFCVLHMTYTTGNSCTPPGCTGIYCQNQLATCQMTDGLSQFEIFQNCIDITVSGSPTPVAPPPPKTVAPPPPKTVAPPPPTTGGGSGSCCSTSSSSARYNGYHQNPSNCNQFCICTNGGQVALQSCAAGLLFSETTKVCDFPASVLCPAP